MKEDKNREGKLKPRNVKSGRGVGGKPQNYEKGNYWKRSKRKSEKRRKGR